MELWSGWDGLTRVSAVTELGVRLLSPRDGDVNLEIRAGDTVVAVSATLRAGLPDTVWIPYRPPIDRPVVLRASVDGREPLLLEKRLHHPASAARVVAVSTKESSVVSRLAGSLPNTQILTAGPASLPRTAPAYDVVAATVLDDTTLYRLEPRQLQALEAHLGGCGRVIVLGVSASVASKLRQMAGCDAAYLEIPSGPDDLVASLSTLLASSPPPLPTAAQLSEVMAEETQAPAHQAVAVYLAFYLVLAALAGMVVHRAWPLVVLPVAALVLAVLAWQGRAPETRVILWAEGDPAESHARYSALLRIDGVARAPARVTLPASRMPHSLPDRAVLHLSPIREGGWIPSIELPTYLLSSDDVYLQGTLHRPPRSPSVRLEAGRAIVTNPGPDTLTGGLLVWRDRRYAVPALAPGGEWAPLEVSAVTERVGAITRLLERRGRAEFPVLLVPLSNKAINAIVSASAATGWLLLAASTPSGGVAQ